MKKLHLGIVLVGLLLVGVAIIAAGTGALFGTDTDDPVPNGESPSDRSNSMTVENVSVHNRTAEGVLYLDIAVAGDLDTEQLGRLIERLYDDPTVNVSTIELVTVQRDIATVAIVTDDRSSTAHVVQRVEHYLNETNWKQSAMQADNSAAEYTAVSPEKVCKVTTAYYQVDFVVGGPIEQLQGPEGTYTPDELIRFAHGSTEEPIVRRSDGEFITDPDLSERIESQAIEVENGMAMVTFSIAEGKGPIKLSLVSYTKPGPGWSRAMEHLQEFVDADTETFEAGGPYTLRVDLPDAKTGSCKTPEPPATPTDIPTETATVETPPPTPASPETPPPTPAPTPPPTPTEPMATLDLRVDGNGQSVQFEFGPIQNGKRYSTVFQLRNVGNTPGNYLCVEITNVGGAENGRLEPERDAEVHDQPGSELPQYLDISMAYGRGGEYYGFYRPTALTAENTKQCVALDEGLARGNPIEFRIVVAVAHEDISNAMSDSATFDVVLTLYDENPNAYQRYEEQNVEQQWKRTSIAASGGR